MAVFAPWERPSSPTTYRSGPGRGDLGCHRTAWKVAGVDASLKMTAQALTDWLEPGWLKMAVEFMLAPTDNVTQLTTTTRIVAADPYSDWASSRYWVLIRPAATLIRREVLHAVGRRAENQSRLLRLSERNQPCD